MLRKRGYNPKMVRCDQFERVKGKISKRTRELLETYSKKYNQPMSMSIAIAIDNELGRDRPFDSSFEPGKTFSGDVSAAEKTKVLDLLKRANCNRGKTDIILCWRDVGAASRDEFVNIYHACVKSGEIFEGCPPCHVHHMYNLKYKWVYLKK